MKIDVGCWHLDDLDDRLDEYEYEEIPADATFNIRSKDLLLEGVVSKGGRTPFRFWGLPTYDQGVVEVEIYLNTEDYSDWSSMWGDRFSFTGRRCDTSIPIAFSHPQVGELIMQVGLSDTDSGLIATAKLNRVSKIVATLPLKAIKYVDRLLSIEMRGLDHCGWEPDPSEVERLTAEVERWNSTQWVALPGTYMERQSAWWQDPTGYFQGKDRHTSSPWGVYFNRPQVRDVERELRDGFPKAVWLAKWLPELLPQWNL